MNRSILRAALMASSALFSSAALAQQQPTPPEHYTLNAQGVDLVTGGFTHAATDVVIGQPGQGGIVHGRVYVNGGWRDTLSGTIAVSSSTYTVSLGAESEVFTKSGSIFTARSNNGSTLSQSGSALTFTTSSGVVATYSTTYSGSTSPYQANGAALMSVVQPNGERLDYQWNGATYCAGYSELGEDGEPTGDCLQYRNAVRLDGVINNRGYAIDFLYASDSPPTNMVEARNEWLRRTGARGVNRAVDPCSTFPGQCGGTSQNWPSVQYAAGEYGGGIQTVTDQSGRTTTYGYGVGGLTSVRLPGSTSDDIAVSYTGGKVSSVIDASGTWNYSYSDSGSTRTTTASGPLGQQVTAVSDLAIGRAKSVRNALNETTSYEYDSQRRLQKITAPEGNATTIGYDPRGNVTAVISSPKPGSQAANIVTYASYPSSCANVRICNQPTTTTDARGGVTNYSYDPNHGGVTTITGPAPVGGAARPETRIAYAPQTAYFKNTAGSLVAASSSVTLPTAVSTCAGGTVPSCVGTANEIRSTLSYGQSNVANNLLPTASTTRDGTGALSATTTMTYTAVGDVASVDGPLAGSEDTTRYRYDDARRLVGVVGPDPDGSGPLLRRAQRISHDAAGRMTLMEQGTVTGTSDANWNAFNSLQQVATQHDALGRVTHQRLQANGATHALTQASYDAAGRLDCSATRMNPGSFGNPPASACTSASDGSFGPDRIMKHEYDETGRLKATTSGFGSGSPITEKATYTPNGQPRTLTDGRGNVSTLVYDEFDRLGSLQYPNASGGGSASSDHQAYTYDRAGNVESYRTRGGQTFNSTYDALNRLTAVDAPTGTDDVSYSYDNVGRMLTASNGSQTTTQTWDALGRLTSEAGPLGTMSYEYDLAGRRTRQAWPDSFSVTNRWNLADEMTAILQGGTTSIVGFSYDNLGRRTGITRGNGVTSTYGYDAASRLTSLSHDVGGTGADVAFAYSHNPAGQIVTKTTSNPAYSWTAAADATTYANDGRNRVTQVNGASVGYDGNGNIINDTSRGFGYDAANRLTSVNGGSATINYDALGRLYNYAGTYNSRYVYSGVEIAGFANSGSTLANRFVRGPGVDEIVANFTSNSSTPAQYWAADERGSLVNLSEGGSGASTGVNTYDEYGQPAAGNLGRLQYTGQLWMPDFGAYHYKARAYAPQLGRFMQADPVGYRGGINLHVYTKGDPINRSDPSGLDWMVTQCSRQFRIGVEDGGKIVWETFTSSYECTIYIPGGSDVLTGTPSHYAGQAGGNNEDERCSPVGTTELSFFQSPYGLVGLPAQAPGTPVVVGQIGVSVAAGLGFTGAVGRYSYTATNGGNYSGFFASPGLAVGGGASATFGLSGVTSLSEFFGSGWSVAASAGPVGVNVTGGDNGLNGGGAEVGLGAGAWGTSTYAHPVGPAVLGCGEK